MSHSQCANSAARPQWLPAGKSDSSSTFSTKRGRHAASISAAVLGGVLLLGTIPAFAGCNSGDTGETNLLTTSACQGRAFGAFSMAIGSGATTNGDNALAVGRLSGSADFVHGALNIGNMSSSFLAGNWSMGIGNGLNDGTTSPKALGAYSIAIGQGDGANFEPVGADIVVKLKGAKANGFLSMAIGTAANATAGGSTAIGHGSNAIANDSLALGEFSDARGESSVAIGLFSTAVGGTSVAVGRNARTSKAGSVALGSGSVATQANVVSVGDTGLKRRIVNVAAAKSPDDAVTLAQLQAALATVHRLEARIAELERGMASASAR